jgi:hypothetical protein
MMTKCNALFISALVLFSFGCDDDDNPKPVSQANPSIYVLNEGPFSAGSGSISQIDLSTNTVFKDVFFSRNGFPAGAILNDFEIIGNQYYIVSNLSAKVEVASVFDWTSTATVSGFSSPRAVADLGNNRIGVSDWGTNKMYILSSTGNTIIDSVSTGSGPEKMVVLNDNILIMNTGGFGLDSTLTVINRSDLSLKQNLTVGDVPNSARITPSSLWVLCSGFSDWMDPSKDTPGRLLELNPNTLEILRNVEIPLSIGHPADLIYNANNASLYFLSNTYGGSIYSCPIANPSNFQKVKAGGYYSLDWDPIRSNIIAGNPLSFAESGWVIRLSANNTLIDSIEVGLIPTDYIFR